MESQPQNPEFRKNPENIHPCLLLEFATKFFLKKSNNQLKAKASLSFPYKIHIFHMHYSCIDWKQQKIDLVY